MRFLGGLVLLALLLAGSVPSSPTPILAPSFLPEPLPGPGRLRYSQTVVLITSPLDLPDHQGIGAGVIIAQTQATITVVTAWHMTALGALTICVPDHRRCALETPRAILFPSRAVDLAILILPHPPFAVTPAVIAAVPAGAGSVVTVEGHPQGRLYQASPAHVLSQQAASTVLGGPADRWIVLRCGTCNHGDSGGGVFNRRGELLGIISLIVQEHTRRGLQTYMLAEPIAAVSEILNRPIF